MSKFIDHFDHFVVAVDDVLTAEDFYLDVLGCSLAINSKGRPMRMGLQTKEWAAGLRPHTFFIAAGKRIGVYLQSGLRPQKPDGVYGAPTYSFETTPKGLNRAAQALANRAARYDGPYDDDSAIAAQSLFFNDPAGNHFHLFTPRQRGNIAATGADDGQLTGVGYLRLEAPDLEKSIRFYRDLLDLEFAGYGRNAKLGAREAVMLLPSGQSVILTEVPFSHQGVDLDSHEAGPHLAFYVRVEAWDNLCATLDAAGLDHGDHGAELKDRHGGGERDTYVSDPAGYVIQLVSDTIV